MDSRIVANQRYLTDLFSGPDHRFRGHAIVMDAPVPEKPGPGDLVTSPVSLARWTDWLLRWYESHAAFSAALGDDAVPYARTNTGTELFAVAMGCDAHVPADSPAFALPRVSSPQEADALPEPTLDHPAIQRVFTVAQALRRRLGPDVPIGMADIQSPFDVAALVWRKEDMMMALYDDPEAVQRLVDKCGRLIVAFLREFMRRVPNTSLCHCPNAWAPPSLGCWLSEDEAGSLSPEQFERFCLPWLERLSREFGGVFMHCCATADHQYGCFNKIPNLRGLNRVFQSPGPAPAVKAFAGRSVLIQAWSDEALVHRMIDLAEPGSRFLFNMPCRELDESRRVFDRLRQRCPRRD